MPARPWFPFYPSDWRGDVNLRPCSPRARAVWVEMICVMEMADPPGYLRVAGRPLNDVALAQQAGMRLRDVRAGLAELDTAVFNRESDGTIYSRRIVHREEVRQRRAAGGAKSLDNNNVPRPKEAGKDTLLGHPSRISSEDRSKRVEDGGETSSKDILKGPPQIPDTRYQIPETREKKNPASATQGDGQSARRKIGSETWVTPYFNAWIARYQGEPAIGPLVKGLAPLRKRYAAATILTAWKNYLATTEAAYASPARFASTFGTWLESPALRPGARPTQHERNERALADFMQEEV